MPDEVQVIDPPHAPAGGDNPSDTPKAPAETLLPSEPAPQTPEEKAAAEKLATETKAKTDAEAAKLAAETKAKEETAKAQIVSADKLKLPDGSLVPKTALDEIAKEVLDGKGTLEDAQKRVDGYHKLAESIRTSAQAALKAQGDKWLSEVKADTEIGGEHFNETNQLATRAFKTLFGDAEFKDFLASPYSVKPGIIKGLVRYAKAVGDSVLVPGDGPSKTPEAKTLGEAVYGKDYDATKVAAGPQA